MRRKVRSVARMLVLFLIILSLLLTVLLFRRSAVSLMQKHLKAMVKSCGLRIHLRGSLPPPDETFLLLSNHVSYWDILALGSLFPLAFIAKDSISRWPVLGQVTSLCNTIYVSRDQIWQRWRSLRQLQKRIQNLSYCVFPEGTTTAGTCPKLSLWHRGNIAVLRNPGRPVWLAGLHYRDHAQQAWVDDDALLPHLYQTMQADAIDLVIHIECLRLDPDQTLQQASIAAWSQTAKLCRLAQDDVERNCIPNAYLPEKKNLFHLVNPA